VASVSVSRFHVLFPKIPNTPANVAGAFVRSRQEQDVSHPAPARAYSYGGSASEEQSGQSGFAREGDQAPASRIGGRLLFDFDNIARSRFRSRYL
jgi:hypothetical protein